MKPAAIGLAIGAALLAVAAVFGFWMARLDAEREDKREVCEKLRSELIEHGAQVYGERVPPDVQRRWETMCQQR